MYILEIHYTFQCHNTQFEKCVKYPSIKFGVHLYYCVCKKCVTTITKYKNLYCVMDILSFNSTIIEIDDFISI